MGDDRHFVGNVDLLRHLDNQSVSSLLRLKKCFEYEYNRSDIDDKESVGEILEHLNEVLSRKKSS